MKKNLLAIVGRKWCGHYLGRQIACMGNCYLFDTTNNVDFAKRFSEEESLLVSQQVINVCNEWVQVVPVNVKSMVQV